jgi:cysteine desulfurase
VRLTFGRYNRDSDVDAVADALADVIARLREISPLGKGADPPEADSCSL